MSYQIGIDVGGTFTDLVAAGADGVIFKTKSPSTPGAESEGIMATLADAATHYSVELDELLASTEVIVLGTTVVTNTMLEYSGANTGLITTGGFRDVIELRRSYREHLFDLRLPAPHPIIPRHKRLGVTERIDFRGDVQIPLNEKEARSAVARLKELEVESIAVCFLFSFMNPAHERRVREIVEKDLPDVPVTLSSEILPQVREFERLSTTMVNAYTRPKVERYLTDLDSGLKEAGFGGELFIMHSHGGMIDVDYAGAHSVELLVSGPAGGVVAGAEISSLSGYRDVITVDMGGTSYDACLVKDSEPATGTEAWVSRYRVATPMVDIHTIGAGGGSIAWIDDGGALRVGPQSAGAFPGPVCYGRGGTEPTVTDADLVLGYISPEYFLGGKMALDQDAARETIEKKIAGPLGTDVVEAASGIFRIANNSMSNAVRHVTVAQGRDPRDFAMCVFGGAGAIHAGAQAPDLGIKTILVPKAASVLSALGNQVSNFKITKVQRLHPAHERCRARRIERSLCRDAGARRNRLGSAGEGARDLDGPLHRHTLRRPDPRSDRPDPEPHTPRYAAQPEHGIQRLPRSTPAALRFQTTRATERGADAQARSDRRPRNRPAPLRAVWRRGPCTGTQGRARTCISRKAPSSSKRLFTTGHWSSPGT